MNSHKDIEDKSASLGNSSDDKQEAAPVIARAATASNGGLTDEPPVIIGNGSVLIDLPPDKDIELDHTRPPDARLPRPFIYVLKEGASPTIRALGRIQVLSLRPENNDPVRWLDYDRVPELLNCQLHVWLEQQVTVGDDVDAFESVNPSDEETSQIVLSGNPFTLELDKELRGPFHTHKPHSPFRYTHPGYNAQKHFRIRKWKLLFASPEGPQVIIEQDGNEDYRIHASFWHDEH